MRMPARVCRGDDGVDHGGRKDATPCAGTQADDDYCRLRGSLCHELHQPQAEGCQHGADCRRLLDPAPALDGDSRYGEGHRESQRHGQQHLAHLHRRLLPGTLQEEHEVVEDHRYQDADDRVAEKCDVSSGSCEDLTGEHGPLRQVPLVVDEETEADDTHCEAGEDRCGGPPQILGRAANVDRHEKRDGAGEEGEHALPVAVHQLAQHVLATTLVAWQQNREGQEEHSSDGSLNDEDGRLYFRYMLAYLCAQDRRKRRTKQRALTQDESESLHISPAASGPQMFPTAPNACDKEVHPARCRGCVISTITMADMVNMPAAPMPWTTRAPISTSMGGRPAAVPAPARNSSRPVMYMDLRPVAWDMWEKTSWKTVCASR